MDDKKERYVNFSSKNDILKARAITGTSNWTRAAIVFSRYGKIVYHNEYPRPDIIAPEHIAKNIPKYVKFMFSG